MKSYQLYSTIIGIYFGWVDRKNKDDTNYALGGQKFTAMPVALSLTATSLSAITMMGEKRFYRLSQHCLLLAEQTFFKPQYFSNLNEEYKNDLDQAICFSFTIKFWPDCNYRVLEFNQEI